MAMKLNCLGALALELSPEQGQARSVLERPQAERLAEFLARDLARLLPGVDSLDGAFAAALFDPAELLRPGWPVHAALVNLAEIAPGARGGRVIAFGAHQGQMPAAELQPDPRLGGGLLRLLPFALIGEAAAVEQVGRAMEERLLDTGMAQAHTALEAQGSFGVALEHARFLSIHDLCALTAAQYQHAGLDGYWRLIEAALLAPESEEWLDDGDGLLAVYRAGLVRLADPAPSTWRQQHGAGHADAVEAFTQWQRRQRQLLAILGAHGIAVEKVPVQLHEDLRAALRPTAQ